MAVVDRALVSPGEAHEPAAIFTLVPQRGQGTEHLRDWPDLGVHRAGTQEGTAEASGWRHEEPRSLCGEGGQQVARLGGGSVPTQALPDVTLCHRVLLKHTLHLYRGSPPPCPACSHACSGFW